MRAFWSLLGVGALLLLLAAGPASAAQRTLVIEMKSFNFDRKAVSVDLNDQVTFIVYNNDSVAHVGYDAFHNFHVDGYDAGGDVPAGEVRWFNFTANQEGSFHYKCHVQGHTQMDGTLTVRGAARTPGPEFVLLVALAVVVVALARKRRR